MDAKDLRIEPALSERSNDASKYTQSGTALQSNRNKSYQDIGSNPSAKVDAATGRPCAVIGPDRVVPPSDHNDAYLKKASVEPWPCTDSPYHRPPEYPLKAAAAVYHNPTRNISPRQTFQENMQRIMVPPTYSSAKVSEDSSYIHKLNVNSDAKYCDVPYTVNPSSNDPKNIRSVEMCLPNANQGLVRPASHGWPPSGVNVRAQRPYVPSEMYQFAEYPNCAGPRPVSISRPHRTIPEESAYIYPESYYQEPNIRFKPYPNVKDRYPQQRYDYITNYSNPFHPPCPPQKYEIPKSLPPHPYSAYPHFKYVDGRIPEPLIEGYQRPFGQQGSYNIPYRNQIMHPAYGHVMNNSQSKLPPYPPDGSFKQTTSNKLPHDSNGKIYIEYDNARMKSFPPNETFYPNEIPRHHVIPKGPMSNYPSINVQPIPPNSYYKKDNPQIKNYEYINHFKNLNSATNISHLAQRHMSQFSPNTIAISPTESNTSNDASQTHSNSQEDCGYVSQSSTTSIRSIEIGHNKIPNDYYGRYYDPKYGPVIRTGPSLNKLNRNNSTSGLDNKDKKEMDVRKFLQMWNEGDDDNAENSSNKAIVVQPNPSELNNISKQHGVINNDQEQLYVLGLVNVPSEELSKYEHIQKVSKLPENIKGYNSIELLNQFEEVIESSNLNSYKLSSPKDFPTSKQASIPKQTMGHMPRPISPLDVEAKISQSVIHKEVGCNFEIKPCSPKMLNVEIAAPVQNILNERVIEKVTNPLTMITSPMLNGIEDSIEHCKIPNVRQDQRLLEDTEEISSCKMINTQFSNNDSNSIKGNYSLQDFESNAGICLASLPRLDNDIELNFPEVNQQFINANKGDTAMLTQMRDLPELSLMDQTDKILRDTKPDILVNNELSPKVETEREFTKLSKYRKTKTNISDGRHDKLAINHTAFRTDSVIIKNPENIKSTEIVKEQPNMNKTVQMDHQTAVNSSSQVNFEVDVHSDSNIQNECNYNNTQHNPSEVAIDFRLNKHVDQFGITDSIEEIYKPIQHTKDEDKLTNIELRDDTDEVIRSLETDNGIKTKINCNYINMEKDLLCIEKAPNNEIILSNDVSFETLPHENNERIGNLCSSDSFNTLKEISDLQHPNPLCTSEINTSENAMLETQISKENECKLPKSDISDQDKLVEPQTEISLNQEMYTELNNEIQEAVPDLSTGQSNTNQPENANLQIVGVLEPSNSDSHSVKSEIQQTTPKEVILCKGVTCELITAQINEHNIDDSMDISSGIVQEQRESKEESVLHSDNLFCDSKHNVEKNDSFNTDEGFVSIDEKQSCDLGNRSKNLSDNEVFHNDINYQTTTPLNKRFGYGSKELYSPWIQNLIMFHEGLCFVSSPGIIETPPTTAPGNTSEISELNDNSGNKCSKTDCNLEKNNTIENNGISDNIVKDSLLHSKDDVLIGNNARISSDCGPSNTKINMKNDTTRSPDIPLQMAKLCDNNRIESEELDPEKNSHCIAHNDKLEKVLLTDESALNTCIDMEPEALTVTMKDNIKETLDDERYVNTEKDVLFEAPFNIAKDEDVKNKLLDAPVINSCISPTSEISTYSTKDNVIREIVLDECDINTHNNVSPKSTTFVARDEVIEKILVNESAVNHGISESFITDTSEVSNPSAELDELKQPINIHEDCTNKKEKEDSACNINLVASKQNNKYKKSLKRSLSDSALNNLQSEHERENISIAWPYKRSKLETENIDESDIIAQKLCNILQNNRRNSISAVYNEENVSFCILIEDNTIITEENEDGNKICYTEISDDCLNEINNSYGCRENPVDVTMEEEACDEENKCEYSDSIILHGEDDLSPHRTWVEDVACVETVVSDDIAEDIIISSASTPKEIHFWDGADSNYYENSDKDDDILVGSPAYEEALNHSSPKLHEICESPQIYNNERFISNDTPSSETCHELYDNESLEKILSESNSQDSPVDETPCVLSSVSLKNKTPEEKENINLDILSALQSDKKCSGDDNKVESKIEQDCDNSKTYENMQDGTVHSCESSTDNVFSYKDKDENTNYATSSSPEVSSTTSEEKNSGILLKITNYNGSKVSQINRFNTNSNNRISCKFTEKTDYVNVKHHPNRPLITKAAQKYIPPIKESIRDLKVKLSLPPHSLLKLKQMKTSKDEPKPNKQRSHPSRLPKKPKPKFEDVLKSIDEIQIKMHKEKTKKVRKSIPKVVIKKNENGSHYASTSNKDTFNPDLTGRKWQPWVFIEKNNFIDKMAMRRKTKAIFSHRKNTYVLAEKFHKYKSASSTKFIISQPKLSETSTGQLKYTIRLKHSY